MFKKLGLIAASGLLASSAFAATHKYGVGVGLPSGGGIGGQPTVAFAYGLNADTSLRANFGLQFIKKENVDSQWGLGVDLGYRKYLNDNAVRIFWQPGISIGKKTSASPHGKNFYLGLEAGVGGEYFVNTNWSFGAQANLALLFENSFNDIKLTTGTTSLTANYYW